MKAVPLPLLLSFNGGYVDTVGFLALGGLFTAHVTGNFVTLGASLALGMGGTLSKLLALPVFCAVVFVSRIVGLVLQRSGRPVLRPLLVVKLVLLIVAAAIALAYGPFGDPNSPTAFAIGMVLVAAMAVQNGIHRVHLAKSPPSTLMTGTTTQIMLDLADIAVGGRSESTAAVYSRLKRMVLAVVVFALGCAIGALAFILSPVWSFVVPAVLAVLALVAHVETPEGD
ncbi:YoaK family protein [Rhizobium miluonense]|jgi:uncharacterized membrane protein YoaK (UPF0700 family)|uniref:Uncharacterized membrane protein YoaK (UPF0700 family) n=1 Tax=Rhizobium miluonense TaxID=411945 RepID=A0ABU1SYR2_9HYPH|nr:YoaK family protein [Rhizobium miluonense]MDR6904128.1 uncharacterized membrane protein YoaK (UPF0700 family) [Rhizobium miluonense]